MFRRYRNPATALCAVVAAVAAVAVVAIGSAAPALSQVPSDEASAPLLQNGVEYLSGGIGEDQVAAMRQLASQYSLSVMVAAKSGAYLSDVDVSIASAKGKNVLSVRTDGPYLLVRLPAGRYRVTVQSGQANQTRDVTVPTHGTARLDFHLATNES